MASWTFIHAADVHKGWPESNRFDPIRNRNWQTGLEQIEALEPELMLLGGDLTRDGTFHEIELRSVRDDLDALRFPTFVIPGNHDVGEKFTTRQGAWPNDDLARRVNPLWIAQYTSRIGPLHWTFMHRNVRFTGLSVGVIGSGLPEEERLWHLVEKLPALSPAEHHVVVIHYPLWMHSLDEPQWDHTDYDQYLNWYLSVDREPRLRLFEGFQRAGVELVITAHLHVRRPIQEVAGIRFLTTPCIGGRRQFEDLWPDGDTTPGFHRFVVAEGELQITFVPLAVEATIHEGEQT